MVVAKLADNLNKWHTWYTEAEHQIPYGDTVTYYFAEDWLRGLSIEDWGCGFGWFRNIHYGDYFGIDGTESKWCDKVADLTEYESDSPGILLRHVLEHNYDWQKILDNAVNSFARRLCIILFTPVVPVTTVLDENVAGLGVPDIAFNINDILSRINHNIVYIDTIKSGSIYGEETIIRIQRNNAFIKSNN